MCVQYCGGAQYGGGVFSTVGDIITHVGGYLEYLHYRVGYHDKCEGISWVPWVVFSTVGDILSTVGGVQCCGGKIFCYLSISTVLNTSTVLMIFPTSIMIFPHGSQITKDNTPPPHGIEHTLYSVRLPHWTAFEMENSYIYKPCLQWLRR